MDCVWICLRGCRLLPLVLRRRVVVASVMYADVVYACYYELVCYGGGLLFDVMDRFGYVFV